MRIALHRSWDELQHLSADWNHLLSRSSSDTIFLTWEWCEAWWKAYGDGRSLFVISVWDGAELVGVAPFYRDHERRWSKQWICLRIIGHGSGDSDYLDCFTQPGREREVIGAVLEFLNSVPHDWDWIEIGGAPQHSSCLAALSEGALAHGWRFSTEAIACASLELPKQWAQYLNQLRPRIRTKVRSAMAYLEGELRTAPEECATLAELETWLPQLFEVHTRRWENKNGPGVFRGKARQLFYRELSQSALQRGWLAFHRLSWGERPLALQYGFRYHNRLYVLQEGYDPSFEMLRPGLALRGWILRAGIEEGLTEYDFLAGNARHKLDWGARLKVSHLVRLARTPGASRVSISFPQMSRSLREGAGRLLPSTARSWRQRLVVARKYLMWGKPNARPMPLVKRLARWSASCLHGGTPMGAISRHLADRYTWECSSQGIKRLRSRSLPVCTIFRYHRVNDAGDPFFDALPVAQFHAQMEYLVRNFHMVSLDEWTGGMSPRNGQKHLVAITFDDGYRDNFIHAFPVLREMKIPATIFLTTGYVEAGQLPWYDQVRLAFKLTLQARISIDDFGGPNASLVSQEQRLKALARTLEWLRTVDDDTRLRALPELFKRLRVPAELNLPSTMLTWGEIRKMHKLGISFGAHTVTHPVLGSLSVSRLKEEIWGSKQTVEERIQVAVRHFSYPFGKQADLGGEAKRIVQTAGFQTAVTTIPGVNGPEQDPLELKRYSLDEPDLGMFGLKFDWSRMTATANGGTSAAAGDAGLARSQAAAGRLFADLK